MEHVPPECFFPTGHKLNLITVPSCPDHNLRKSKDDEYVRSIIAPALGNNAYDLAMSTTKVNRSFSHSSVLVAAVFQGVLVTKLKDGMETGGVTVDLDRWDNFFRHFANAIYWHDFKIQHHQSWEIVNPNLTVGDLYEANPYNEVNKKFLSLNFQQLPTPNPEIFQYSFFRYSNESYAYKFVFYEGFIVYALVKPTDATSYNTHKNEFGV
ncbi:MAG: hypothetical protein JXA06_01535 [Bacteroidetes bacterium]|nr:hypothetical protein [Bacteroidota bacterium]